MSRQYQNPPIAEALCEFRFAPECISDPAIPGLLYSKKKIADNYPIREKRIVQENKIRQENDQTLTHEIQVSTWAVFRSADRHSLLQVGGNLLSVNVLKPYPTWGAFQPLIMDALNSLLELVEQPKVTQLGLRYINKIELPGEGVPLDEYFSYGAQIAPGMPIHLLKYSVGCVFPFREGRDSCRVQINDMPEENQGRKMVLLDIDYFYNPPEWPSVDQIQEWINTAHTSVEETFERCITDQARSLFMVQP